MTTRDSYAYLDTSAFVKLCWPEPESQALHTYLGQWPLRVAATLLLTEVLRAAQRESPARLTHVQRLIQLMPMLEIDRSVLRQAGLLGPAGMRSLDAIHLAAAMSLGPDLGVVVTYDKRMAGMATLFGLTVASPS